jgi:hypothetical protein
VRVIVLDGTTEADQILDGVRRNEGLTVCLLGKENFFGDLQEAYDCFTKGYNRSLLAMLGDDVIPLVSTSGLSFEKFCQLLSTEQIEDFLFHNFSHLLPVLDAMAESRGVSVIVGNVKANNILGLGNLLRLFGRKSALDQPIRIIDSFKYVYHYGKFLSFISGRQLLTQYSVIPQSEGYHGDLFVSAVPDDSIDRVIEKANKSQLTLHLHNLMKAPFEVLEI